MLDGLLSDFSDIDIFDETGDFMVLFEAEDMVEAEEEMLCGDRIENCDLITDEDDDEDYDDDDEDEEDCDEDDDDCEDSYDLTDL